MSSFLQRNQEKWALVSNEVNKPQPLSFWKDSTSVARWLNGINDLVKTPVDIQPLSMYYESCYNGYYYDENGVYTYGYFCDTYPSGFPWDFIDDVTEAIDDVAEAIADSAAVEWAEEKSEAYEEIIWDYQDKRDEQWEKDVDVATQWFQEITD